MKSKKTNDIYGLGNALVDIMVDVSHDELKKHPVRKGAFNELDVVKFRKLLRLLADKPKKYAPGGSAANAVAMFSQLGGKAVFAGKIGIDEAGKAFEKAMRKVGTTPLLSHSKADAITGQGIGFITPDSDRTFAMHLGASTELVVEDIDVEKLRNSEILHIEGYLIDHPGRKAAFHALAKAQEHGVKVSIDCADPGVIERNKADFKKIIREYADIVFANEDEAKALTGEKDPRKALKEIARHVDVAIVKLGKKGSLVMHGQRIYMIKAHKVDAVDTTGAGDAFAGAFLYALVNGKDFPTAGKLASFMAAKVVSQRGARLDSIPGYAHVIAKRKYSRRTKFAHHKISSHKPKKGKKR